MTRALIVLCVFCSLLVACTQKVVCPAYQSAYIYDKDALRKKFSYFVNDSTPKAIASVSKKNRYLIAKPVTYKEKTRSLQTIAMKPVNPVVPDSLKDGYEKTVAAVNIDSVNRNVNDGTAVLRIDTLAATKPGDSIYMISIDKEVRVLKYNAMQRKYYVDSIGFNVQQDNYMWYMREILVLPDVRLKQQQDTEAKTAASAVAKKEKKGFFKNLFKKKDKTAADTVQHIVADDEDYGYDDFEGKPRDTTQVDQVNANAKPAKKGFFSFLKKKDKPVKKQQPAKKEDEPVKKEEDDTDGF